LIVPAVVTVNERLLVPTGASVLDQFSAAGFVGVEGDVAVFVSSPHAETIAAMSASTGHPPPLKLRRTSEDFETRGRTNLCVTVSVWLGSAGVVAIMGA
jgi:hypothetical protein